MRRWRAPQSYLLLGSEEHLHMFTEAYASAMHWLAAAQRPWLGEADLYSGHHPAQLWVSSLAAFWPGLQVRPGLQGSGLGGLHLWLGGADLHSGHHRPQLWLSALAAFRPAGASGAGGLGSGRGPP